MRRDSQAPYDGNFAREPFPQDGNCKQSQEVWNILLNARAYTAVTATCSQSDKKEKSPVHNSATNLRLMFKTCVCRTGVRDRR